jgi:hypothetical protein
LFDNGCATAGTSLPWQLGSSPSITLLRRIEDGLRRPGADHVTPSRVHKTARAVAPVTRRRYLLRPGPTPLHPQSGPPGAAPLTTLAPISRNARWPDAHCSSGFGRRSSPVPGARPRLRPPARRGRVFCDHTKTRSPIKTSTVRWPSNGDHPRRRSVVAYPFGFTIAPPAPHTIPPAVAHHGTGQTARDFTRWVARVSACGRSLSVVSPHPIKVRPCFSNSVPALGCT